MASANPEPLVTAKVDVENFHSRVGEPRHIPNNAGYGFPTPGPQLPTAARHYFMEEPTWKDILDHGEYDDIVVGSGFCALAYIDQALRNNPERKILVLERGEFWLPDHFQNLPLPSKPSETFPWSLASSTFRSDVEPEYIPESYFFFGGRSTFWSAWCPRAIHQQWKLMRGFPKKTIELASQEGFWRRAEELLHVTPAASLSIPTFGILQQEIDRRLEERVEQIREADFVLSAPLAVGKKTSLSTLAFEKFSTPGAFLAMHARQLELAQKGEGSALSIATNTTVERFELDTDKQGPNHSAVVLHTSRGALCFPRARTNIILAAGVIPNTTLLVNSVGEPLQGRAGSRLSGHLLSRIVARFPLDSKFNGLEESNHLKIGASYVAGMLRKNEHQYHIQITAVHSPHPATDAENAARLSPDYAEAATRAQLEGSENHIVIVCISLGEASETNCNSWARHKPSHPDVTMNIRLQIDISEEDKELWQLMDEATYDSIKVMAADNFDSIDYWHQDLNSPGGGSWQRHKKPPSEQIRAQDVIHKNSTLWMSDDLERDQTASVGLDYRPRGCDNVYVTGGALFPSSGSWNPTLTMCALAQNLAQQLVPPRNEEAVPT